jgi:hypothetical protein
LRFDEENHLVLRDHVDGYSPIGSYAEFQLINTNSTTLAGIYELEATLDLMNIEWTPVDAFKGTFDGENHTLSNLKINTPTTSFVGIFGRISESARIQNFGVIDGEVEGYEFVGAICGLALWNSQIIACYNENVKVTGKRYYVGGISGSVTTDAKAIACYNTGEVTGIRYTAGISGSTNGIIIACYNTGKVTGDNRVGGISGGLGRERSDAHFPSITACYNTGAVTGNEGYLVGSVSGEAEAYIIACYWVPGGNATQGTGEAYAYMIPETAEFSATEWPGLSSASYNNVNWEVGDADGSGPGHYWKSLGGPTAGPGNTPEYPKLYFEQ